MVEEDEGASVVRDILNDPTLKEERGEREEWRLQTGVGRKEDVRGPTGRSSDGSERAKRRRLFSTTAKENKQKKKRASTSPPRPPSPPPSYSTSSSSSSSSSNSPLAPGSRVPTEVSVGIAVVATILSMVWWLLRRPTKPSPQIDPAKLAALSSLDEMLTREHEAAALYFFEKEKAEKEAEQPG